MSHIWYVPPRSLSRCASVPHRRNHVPAGGQDTGCSAFENGRGQPRRDVENHRKGRRTDVQADGRVRVQTAISTLPVMGFGRNPGRAAAQHFSEEEIAQLVRWYHDGAGKIINKVKGKGAAAALIKMKLHDPGDEDITQFEGKYAQRISAWFSSYTRVLTKKSEQAKRAGCAEKAAEGVLTADEAKAKAAKAPAKKAKGPPSKKPKLAGASGSGVAGPAATVAGMTSAPTAATHVTPSTKKRKAPAKPTAQLSGAPDSGAAVLPLPAPMRVDADEMMPSTQAPQKAPTPSRKKAKLMVEESGGARFQYTWFCQPGRLFHPQSSTP